MIWFLAVILGLTFLRKCQSNTQCPHKSDHVRNCAYTLWNMGDISNILENIHKHNGQIGSSIFSFGYTFTTTEAGDTLEEQGIPAEISAILTDATMFKFVIHLCVHITAMQFIKYMSLSSQNVYGAKFSVMNENILLKIYG